MASADAVIIGGGCMGSSTAFQLARRGGRGIVLVERDSVGSGPTAKTIGIVRLHYSHVPLIRLAARSLELFTHFQALTGGDSDFTPAGVMILASDAQIPALRSNVELELRLGIDARVLARDEITALEPRMSLDGVAGAVYEPGSGYADGYATTAAFAAAARRSGVEIREHTSADGIVLTGGRVTGVRTAGGVVDTPRVLVTAGPWTPFLLGPIGVDVPIKSSRQQVVQFAPPREFGPLRFICEDLTQGFYARPEAGGTALAGVLEDEPEEFVSPDAFNPGVGLDFVDRVGRLWRRRYPAAADAEFRSGYVSLYDMTPDWQPILGAVDEVPGLYVAAGFSGHGFKLSPALGEVLAAVLAGEAPPIDVSLFRFSRFKTGELIRGRHDQGILG